MGNKSTFAVRLGRNYRNPWAIWPAAGSSVSRLRVSSPASKYKI